MLDPFPKYVLGIKTQCLYVTVDHHTKCYFPDGNVIEYQHSVEGQLAVGLQPAKWAFYKVLDDTSGEQLLMQYAL